VIKNESENVNLPDVMRIGARRMVLKTDPRCAVNVCNNSPRSKSPTITWACCLIGSSIYPATTSLPSLTCIWALLQRPEAVKKNVRVYPCHCCCPLTGTHRANLFCVGGGYYDNVYAIGDHTWLYLHPRPSR